MKFAIAFAIVVIGIAVCATFALRKQPTATSSTVPPSPPVPTPMVKVYDFKSGTVTNMPESQLTPDMVQVRIKGNDELVWAKASEMKMGEYQHPPVSEEVRASLKKIQENLQEVYPKTLAFWEDGFRRDKNAEKEIAVWLHIADVYTRFTTEKPRSIEEKKEAFRILVACSASPREKVLRTARPLFLDAETAEKLVAQYFAKEQ